MVTALVLKIVLFGAALVFVVVIVRSRFVRPQRGKPGSDRIRLHRFWGFGAGALLALGLLAGLLGFGSGNGEIRDPLPFRIASVLLVAVGLVVLIAYRNWFLAPGAEAIAFRTVFGAERVIRYRDIVSRRVVGRGGRMLVLTSADGTRLRVDPSSPAFAPLRAALGV